MQFGTPTAILLAAAATAGQPTAGARTITRPRQNYLLEDVSHLGLQRVEQDVIGPMQDDESLLLFALVRTSHVRRVLEIGGLHGESAMNFLRALKHKQRAVVYTIDRNRVDKIEMRHIPIQKDALKFTPADIGNEPVDLLLLDCHALRAQQHLVQALFNHNLLSKGAYIVLHDTGLHHGQFFKADPMLGLHPWPTNDSEYFIHQAVERQLGTWIAEKYAWQRLSFHDDSPTGTPQKFRHGLTVMQAPSDLGVPKYLDHWPGRGGYMSTQ